MKEVPQIEAIKYALRQSKDGTVVSFVIHPEDLDPALQILPIGTRIMFGWYEIGTDEKPRAASSNGKTPEFDSGNVGSTPTAAAKPKRKFSDLSLPEQCAMRCTDGRFGRYLQETYPAAYESWGGDSAMVVRKLLQIESRAALSTNHEAANHWRNIDNAYERWLTDETYKESIR